MPQTGMRDWRNLCRVVAGPIFVATFLIESATRTDYNWLRHPVSSLALGDPGWIQAVNFLVTGLLMAIFATSLRRGSRWGAILIGLAGIGLIGAGLFVTDPLGGYPPGTPDKIVYTPIGIAHDVFSMLFFLGLPVACILFAIRYFRAGRPGAGAYAVLTAIAFLVFFVLAGMGFEQTPGWVDWGGMMQRISLVIGFAWLTQLALDIGRDGFPVRAK